MSKRFQESSDKQDRILVNDIKAQLEISYPNLYIQCQKVSTVLKKLFPSVTYTNGHRCAKKGRLKCFTNLRPKTNLINQSKAEVFNKAGFSLIKQQNGISVITSPTQFTVNNVRVHKELSLPHDSKTTASIQLTLFGRKLPLSQIYNEIPVDLSESNDLITLLNDVKETDLCSGYTVDEGDHDFMWRKEEDNEENQIPKKRSPGCQLLLQPGSKTHSCIKCRWLESRYKHDKAERELNEAEEAQEDVVLVEEQHRSMVDIIKDIMDLKEITNNQKLLLTSQLKAAQCCDPRQFRWDKRFVFLVKGLVKFEHCTNCQNSLT